MLIQSPTIALEQNNYQTYSIPLRNDDGSSFSLSGLTYTIEVWVATPGGVKNSYGVGMAYDPLDVGVSGLGNATASGSNVILTFPQGVINTIAGNWGDNLVPFSTVYEGLLLVSAPGSPKTYKFAKGTFSVVGSVPGVARP